MKRINSVATVMAVVGGIFISYIGLSYLITPDTIVTGFGFRHWPSGDADGFFTIKGIRDLASGLVIFALLAAKQRQALAIVTAVFSIIPIGDAANVLAHHGKLATALGVHTLTAVFVLATAILLWLGQRRPADVSA